MRSRRMRSSGPGGMGVGGSGEETIGASGRNPSHNPYIRDLQSRRKTGNESRRKKKQRGDESMRRKQGGNARRRRQKR